MAIKKSPHTLSLSWDFPILPQLSDKNNDVVLLIVAIQYYILSILKKYLLAIYASSGK